MICLPTSADSVTIDEVKPWPVLDQRAFRERTWLAYVLQSATEGSEADPAAVLATFLARFAVEVGRGPHIMIGDTRHDARIFTVIVGATSKARKGTSARPVKRLFDFKSLKTPSSSQRLKHIPARTTPGPLSSGEGLIHAVRDPAETPRAFDDDVDPGVHDKRLFVLDEEFAAALTCSRRDGNTLSTVLRCAWDHGTLEPLTKYNRIKATDAHIGITTHITLQELHALLKQSDLFSGFANRFLWVCARRSALVPMPSPIPDGEMQAMEIWLTDIVSAAQKRTAMIFDEKATDRYSAIYEELAVEHPGIVGAVINRAEAQVVRLALIYALLDKSEVIRVEHLEAALSFWQYCEQSAVYIFSDMEGDPQAKKVLEALRVAPTGQMEVAEIYGLFSNHISKERVERIVADLVDSEKVRLVTENTKGRSRRTLVLEKKAN